MSEAYIVDALRTPVGKRRENPDQKGACEVHRHGAPRKRLAEMTRDEARDEVTRRSAERAAKHDTEYCVDHEA